MKRALIGLSISLCIGCNQPATTNASATPRPVPPAASATPAETGTPSASATPAATPGETAGAFEKTLELQGFTFQIACPNDSSVNQLTITPSGLEEVNDVITREVDGTVTEAEIEDLNSDGFPEIFVYSTSAGSGSHGSCIAYASNNGKSISDITIPPVSSLEDAKDGYRGHDEFQVVETTLVQRFPVYKEGDTEDNPTGGTRQIQWKLEPGEATWQMRADKIENY